MASTGECQVRVKARITVTTSSRLAKVTASSDSSQTGGPGDASEDDKGQGGEDGERNESCGPCLTPEGIDRYGHRHGRA